MTWSITATLAILLAGTWFLRNNQTRLEASLRKPEIVRSTAEAARETIQNPEKAKDNPPALPKAPKIELSSVSAVAAESIASRAQGRMKTDEERQHENDLNQQIQALDEEQLEEFVTEVSAIKDLPPAEWSWWVYRALIRLGESNPDKALEILAAQMKASKGFTMAEGTATAIISQIAAKNPDKAFAKLDEYSTGLPGLKLKKVTSEILIQLSRSDLPKTLQLVQSRLEPLGDGAVENVVSVIAHGCYKEDQCRAVVDYMKGFLERCKDPRSRKKIQDDVLTSVAHTMAKNGYASAESWMRETKLSREQYLQMGFSAAMNCNGKDPGMWLEWIGREQPYQSISEEDAQSEWCHKVRTIALHWADRDTQTFGAWLDTQQPSPLKNMCIVEFVYGIIEDHPDTAAGWIEKMDNDGDRNFMYKKVYEKADFKTPEEREDFAKRHGLR